MGADGAFRHELHASSQRLQQFVLKLKPPQPDSGTLRRGAQIDEYIDITVSVVLLGSDRPVQ